jgi:hypothetical protein
VSTAVQATPEVRSAPPLASATRIATDGKFLRLGEDRFLVKGVTYGTFAPDPDGYQFPAFARIAEDFALMASLGINTVRTYTAPTRDLLDEAARHGLRVMIGLPWSQHVAFLDDRKLRRQIRNELVGRVAELGDHPAVLAFAIGNEIPPGVVRWHGRLRIERFLRRVYEDCKQAAPDSLLTYVNFPPTEFLDLTFFDICAFNVYLHRERELRAYLARLQHIAGHKPLLLAEAGADSIREGEPGQAEITAMHVRAAFEEGACGAVAFAWTDEWWRGGTDVDDWKFGLVDCDRRPKPAARAVSAAFADAQFAHDAQRAWPRVSVVVCAYNAADTLEDCLSSLDRLTYPDYEIILVNDGSRDRTSEIGRSHPRVRVVDTPNAGLSAARNVGLAEATGEIVAYTDADTRVDRDWLSFLVQPFLTSDVVGSGGPNVVPADDPPIAQCIARAPGGPTHVLLDDRIAEHVPGCNMAFRRDALVAIGGFNPVFLRAGRRCGCVLAAAGERLEDRLCLGGAGLASPPRVGESVLAAAGRLRRRRDVADGAPPGKISRRTHAVARPHLQPAAVRAIAVGDARQRRRLGNRGVSVGVPHRRAPLRVSPAFDQVAGDFVRAPGDRRRGSLDRPASVGRGDSARWGRCRHRRDDRQEHRLCDAVRHGIAPGTHDRVPGDGRVPALPAAARPGPRPHPGRALAA